MIENATIKFRGNITLRVFQSEDEYESIDYYAGEIQRVFINKRKGPKVVDLHFEEGVAMNVPVKLFEVIWENEQ